MSCVSGDAALDERSIGAPRNHPALRRVAVRAAPQPQTPSGPGLAPSAEAVEGRGRLDLSRDFLPAPSLQVFAVCFSLHIERRQKSASSLPRNLQVGFPPPAAFCSCHLSFFFLLPYSSATAFYPFTFLSGSRSRKKARVLAFMGLEAQNCPLELSSWYPGASVRATWLAARSSADVAQGRAGPGTRLSTQLPLPGADSSSALSKHV